MNMNKYTVNNKIYEGSRTVIYDAVRNDDNIPVVIKLLAKDSPSDQDMAKFNLEYEISSNLGIEGIPKMYEIGKYENSLMIVMEPIVYKTLDKIISERKIGIKEFINMSIRLVEVLGQVHNRKVVHKDINPSNILWDESTNTVKIIDFGSSNYQKYENYNTANTNILEGTLPYISPEQTGRMNKSVDYRSDYYSLGCTFYEILTGRKPFLEQDTLEIIHCHIAKIPIPIHELDSDIPKVVSEIVMKLMAKNPEDRYQSSFGIKYDLEMCLKTYYFEVAKKDISSRFEIPQKLYGRDSEIKELVDGFNNVVKTGLSQMMLISGGSGIGKSSLAYKIHKPVIENKGYFISGKFDEITKNIPYVPIIQAFQEWVKQILSESEEVVNYWKARILDGIGNIGQVIIDIIPQIEWIIGKQPELPELDPSKTKNRFNLAFQAFIRAVATKEHPLAIFIDNMQWADSTTLKMIKMFMINSDIQYIYFIGAFGNSEVDSLNLFINMMDKIKKENRNLYDIKLKALNVENIVEMVSDVFRSEYKRSKKLAEICLKKTNGNPFFLNQFLVSLYEDDLIEFDDQNGQWIWSDEDIEKKEITDNVVTLMEEKIQKLSQKTQDILKFAACCGNEFDINMLSTIYEKTKLDTVSDLKEAVKEGLLLPLENINDLAGKEIENVNLSYKFLHERVQQAVYFLIEDGLKRQVHLKIGQYMLENTSKDQLEERIFEITNNLNIGSQFIESGTKTIKLVALNIHSGIKARKSSAYSMSYEYLKKGIDLLGSKEWDELYQLSLELFTEAAESAYLCGKYDEMEKLIEETLVFARDLLDKVKVYKVKIRSYIAQNKRLEAMKFGIHVLSFFGIKVPENPSKIDILIRFFKGKSLLKNKSYDEILNSPDSTDDLAHAAAEVIFLAASSAYFVEPKVFLVLNFESLFISMKQGYHRYTGQAFLGLSVLYSKMGKIKEALYWGKMYDDHAMRLGTAEGIGLNSVCTGGFIMHNSTSLKDIIPIIKRGYAGTMEVGDLEYAGIALYMISRYYYLMGKNLKEVDLEFDEAEKTLEKLKQKYSLKSSYIDHQAVLNLLGRSDNPCKLTGGILDEDQLVHQCETLNDFSSLGKIHINKCVLDYLFYNYEIALENVKIAERYFETFELQEGAKVFMFYELLINLEICTGNHNKSRSKIFKTVIKKMKKIKKYADFAPENNLHRYYLIEAELMKVKGEISSAMEYYDMAIEKAAENGYKNEEALANERAGIFYLTIGREKHAGLYLLQARKCYRKWGAKAKVEHLDKVYPKLKDFREKINSDIEYKNFKQTKDTMLFQNEAIDLLSVIKASQAISGEIEYGKLIEKLVKIITENSGAQKIIIINKKDEKFFVESVFNVGDSEVVILDGVREGNESLSNVPYSIIKYVERTLEVVFIDDASNDDTYKDDPYVVNDNTKSVCCIPLVYQGKLSRILYIQNNALIGTFTKERLEILNMLSAQMVISIENSKVYENLEELVQERTKELNERSIELQNKNHNIMESISYAKTIQLSILPREELFKNNLAEYFIFWKPKDIVGGDIYWFTQTDDGYIIAVIDCTGHGVPGAFMTMTANSVLNRITGEICNNDPAKILKELNKHIRITLNHHVAIKELVDYDDGMDVGFCYVKPKEKKIIYSGAKIILYMYKQNEIKIIKGDKQGIGYRRSVEDFEYTNHEIDLKGDEIFYITSDGYIDQQGGEKNYGIGRERFKNLIMNVRNQPLVNQKQEFITFMDNYMGNNQQIDDITIVGFKPL